MGQLLVLAAVATLAVPVLIGQHITAADFPSPWLILFLILAEIGISTGVLKFLYPRNELSRCVTFGVVLFLVRLVLCFIASFIAPNGDALWQSVSYRWTQALTPALTYMYSGVWVMVAQYLALILWMPVALEAVVPQLFPRRRGETLLMPANKTAPSPATTSSVFYQPTTFREFEQEFSAYPDLMAWMVFSPDLLPVWSAGVDTSQLETAPEVLLRLNDICRPLLRPEWDQTLRQGLFQTENGYCLLATLPDNFFFTSLWRLESGQEAPKAALANALDRMKKWLQYRFADMKFVDME